MRRIKVFLLNGIILTATSFLLRTIGVSFNVYIANKIGSEAVGVFQLVMSIYLFASTFALSGINLACMRIVSEELACGLEGNIKKAVKKGLLYSLTFGSSACFLLICLAPTISGYWLHHKVSAFPFYVIAISLPFLSMTSCLNGYFSAVRRVGKNACMQVVEQLIQIVVTVYLLNLLLPANVDFACLSLVLGTTISEVVSFLGNLILYWYDTRRYQKKWATPSPFTKRILKISLPIAITSYIRSGLSTFKQLLIPLRLEKTGMSCQAALSSYGQINGMVLPILFFPSSLLASFSSLLIPEFSSFHVRGEKEKMQIAIKKILKYSFLFSFACGGIFWYFSKELSSLIYHSEEISFFLKVLSPLVVFMYVDNMIDGVLKGLDKQVGVMVVNIIDLVTSISFIYFLLPIYGIVGYIIVIFLSEILNFVVSLVQLIQELHFSLDWKNWLLKPILACLFSSSMITLFFSSFGEITILSVLIQIGLFLLLYALFLTFTGCLSKKDLKL